MPVLLGNFAVHAVGHADDNTRAHQSLRAHVAEQISDGSAGPKRSWLITQFENLDVLEKRRFSKLLLYQTRWLGSPQSLVDDPSFFFASDGKTNAASEFHASYLAFQLASQEALIPSSPLAEPHDPRCRFPGRLEFINRALDLWGIDAIEEGHCPELEKWRQTSKPLGISLGYAAMFPNGPSSMFGHTFLRIQTDDGFDLGQILTDPVINFAAVPTTSNPLAYTILGLFGGFPGYLNAEPMYIKLQQYSNAELRDVWDYELNLTPEQASWVPLAAWDLLNHRVDYFYFDDNCALLMLHLIEVADPTRRLSENYWHWVTPSDTVRTVFDSPGLVRQVRFLPSQQDKFHARLDALPEPARSQLIELIRTDDLGGALAWEAEPKEKAMVLDALVDYIDSSERLAGNATSPRLAGIRSAALSQRSRLGTFGSTQPSIQTPPDLRPEDGHRSHGLGLNIETLIDTNRINFNWRPALKAFGEGGLGFSQRMAITFFDTRVSLTLREDDDHKLMLRKFQLVKVQVMSPPTEVAFPLSWFVGAEHVMTPLLQHQLEFRSVDSIRQKNSGFEVPESRLSTGVGFSTVEFWNTYGFVLGGLDVGYLWSDHTVDLVGSPTITPRELRTCHK